MIQSMRFGILALVIVLVAIAAGVLWHETVDDRQARSFGEEETARGQQAAELTPHGISATGKGATSTASVQLPEINNEDDMTLSAPMLEEGHAVFNPEGAPSKWLNESRKWMQDAAPTDIAGKRESAEEGDPEAAFWMYLYYAYCQPGPTTDWQLDAHLARAQQSLDDWVSKNPDEEIPTWISNRIDTIEQRYRMCGSIPPDTNISAQALAWLEAAADAGHVPARFGYYQLAGGLITNLKKGFGFPEPHVLENYRNRTQSYVDLIFAMEHPDRFYLMAQVMTNGIAFHTDFQEAYAYAHAAILTNSPSIERAFGLVTFLEMYVSPEDREAAMLHAKDLVTKN
ncbi:MAG: hypothetical protein AAGA23_13600 [Pseudomonadota bacterium]